MRQAEEIQAARAAASHAELAPAGNVGNDDAGGGGFVYEFVNDWLRMEPQEEAEVSTQETERAAPQTRT